MSSSSCRVAIQGDEVQLNHPAFTMQLSLAGSLRPTQWRSHLSGHAFAISGGDELSCTVDTARHRIELLGWRQKLSGHVSLPPDQEAGFRERCYDPFHPDAGWGAPSPVGYSHRIPSLHADEHETDEQERKYLWARSHFVLPAAAAGQEVSLVLGGYGLFDFDYLRVFLNGAAIGVRETAGVWREPGVFRLTPSDQHYRRLRFGQDNVVALQLKGFYSRPERLERLDPQRSFAQYALWVGNDALFEQYVTVGQSSATVAFTPVANQILATGDHAEWQVTLASAAGLQATITYQFAAATPVLTRRVTLENRTDRAIPLLDLTLGDYQLRPDTPDNGGVGFPVYVGDELFVSLAHPAALNQLDHGRLRLRYFLGENIGPGERRELPDAVYGFGAAGHSRPAFRDHIERLSRRTTRNHRRPYTTFYPMNNDETFIKDEGRERSALEAVVALRENGVLAFDSFALGYFMIDAGGDFLQFDSQRWPNGGAEYLARVKTTGLKLILGLAGTAPIGWSLGRNPVLADCMNTVYAAEGFCLAAEPYKTMVQSAMRDYVRRFGMGGFIIDEVYHRCQNPHHGHRIGNYSITANSNAAIQLLELLDQEAPDLFIQLEWGFRSPWWLRWADTLFEPGGIKIEARNPSERPTLHFRDSITLGLDRAQDYADEIPRSGKDSLGVWLTDNAWNSYVGTDRWQAGLVMDLCRGSLLAQLWGHPDLLSAAEWLEAGRLIGLWKAHPECFSQPRLLGNPWTDDVYGYCCTDGTRAFIALNNCSWSDQRFQLALDSRWGLPDGEAWRLRRWYPAAAELSRVDGNPCHQPGTSFALRPFDVVLLEAIPAGGDWDGPQRFPPRTLPQPAAEPARSIPLSVNPVSVVDAGPPAAPAVRTLVNADGGYTAEQPGPAAAPASQSYRITGTLPALTQSGTLAVVVQWFTGKYPARLGLDSVAHLALSGSLAGQSLAFTPVVRRAETSWQVFRTPLSRAPAPRALELALSSPLSAQRVRLQTTVHVLPETGPTPK